MFPVRKGLLLPLLFFLICCLFWFHWRGFLLLPPSATVRNLKHLLKFPYYAQCTFSCLFQHKCVPGVSKDPQTVRNKHPLYFSTAQSFSECVCKHCLNLERGLLGRGALNRWELKRLLFRQSLNRDAKAMDSLRKIMLFLLTLKTENIF